MIKQELTLSLMHHDIKGSLKLSRPGEQVTSIAAFTSSRLIAIEILTPRLKQMASSTILVNKRCVREGSNNSLVVTCLTVRSLFTSILEQQSS